MENAEEVMQMLEEFSKIKPKDIPRELDDYLSCVAKTGDPVYQWSLVKTLFREKLISVITDFYESTPTLELPPCPNVEPFNYERLKTSLIERFDSFSSAPFTVQRICELLTCPRKEYNRADKYMRAIEKNILVVSTREPGTAKRPYDSDGQSETILNGMPDVKLGEAEGSLLHLPTDLPYLGAPPASNDVTVETTEPSLDLVDTEKVNLNNEGIKYENKELPVEVSTEQSWSESITSKGTADKSELNNIKVETEADVSTDRPIEQNDCDTSNRPDLVLPNIEHSNQDVTLPEEDRCVSDSLPLSPKNNVPSDLPDSIGSSEPSTAKISSEDTVEMSPKSPKMETEELLGSDENVVSSTPADDIATVQEGFNDPADSEAEASGSSSECAQKSEIDVSSMQEKEVNSRIIHTDNPKTPINISEITASKSDDIDLECNEITGTVESPVGSPENNSTVQTEDILKENSEAVEEVEECLHPDSSDDVSLENKITPEELSKSEQCSEADSMSDSDLQQSETRSYSEDVPDRTPQTLPEAVIEDSTLHSLNVVDENSSEVCTSRIADDEVNTVSKSSDSSSGSEDSSKVEAVKMKLTEVQSSTEADAACKEERKSFEPVNMQMASSLTPDSQQPEVGIEEISVDPSCEVEEAMEVDEGSNQMMVTEGENEGEPMDQSDQHS